VKARTLTESGAFLRDSLPFLFTGAPVITTSKDTIILPDGGSSNMTFTIADKYGKMVSATPTKLTLTLSISGGDAASSLTTECDMPSTGPANEIFPTTYHLKITDNTPNGGISGGFTILIVADGASGKTTKTIAGTLLPGSAGSSSYASSIQLLAGSPSASTISVKGTGTTETATMSFVVKDSSGNPVNTTHQATVTFNIVGGPGGGEFVLPTSTVTDANGKVTTTVNAGTKAGVLQVVATIGTIQSAPVTLTIASGLADLAHFTVWTDKQNWPGVVSSGVPIGTVFVQMGDKYANPVQPNTALYFTTNGGIITSSAFTNATGHASAIAFGGNPTPPLGIRTDTVKTLGEGGLIITQIVSTVYSGAPIITFPAYGAGTLPPISDGGFLDVDYYIMDAIGNPISSGNNVTASLSGTAASQLVLSLDASLVTTDTKVAADQQYKVRLTDPTQGSGSGGAFTLTISVTGPSVPNGGTYSKILTGFLQAPGVIGGGGTGRAKSILLVSASATDISVKGTGSSETASLIFEARDSLGQAIDLNHSTVMNFTISAPTLGATLTITSAATDGSGRATTLVQSGTISGVIQIQASTVIGGITVSSLPIRISINSGLPDQRHFSIAAKFYNFPGLDYDGQFVPITVFMADKYSNPVSIGTTAYFYSTHGKIATIGSVTDVIGDITQNFYSQNPSPDPAEIDQSTGLPDTVSYGPQKQYLVKMNRGWTRVYAQTNNDAGGIVEDSIYVLWTGRPVSPFNWTVTGPGAFIVPHGGSAGPWTFQIRDRFGDPLSSGTTITVSATGTVADMDPVTLADTWSGANGATAYGITDFTVNIHDTEKSSDPDTHKDISTTLRVTVNHPLYGSYSFDLASGIVDP
jgi:hypothetical protein